MTIHARSAAGAAAAPQSAAKASPPTTEEARRFIEDTEKRLLDLNTKSQRAAWVYESFITDDTEAIAAQADQAVKDATAILDYFAPLKQWLDEQNKLNGAKVGW
jgi:glycerol-3-phosphate dehydrogenase